MILVWIFSIIFVAQALQPNVYFEYFNKSEFLNYTKIQYRLYSVEGTSVPLGINNYFNISMEQSILHLYRIPYNNTIIFTAFDDHQIFTKSLSKYAGNTDSIFNKVNLNGQMNFQYILHFLVTDIVQKVVKCDFGSRKISGQLFVIQSYSLNKDLIISGKIFPSRFDAYFHIFEKDKQLFCNMTNDLQLTFVIFGFLAVLGFAVSIKVIHWMFEKLRKFIFGGILEK